MITLETSSILRTFPTNYMLSLWNSGAGGMEGGSQGEHIY